MRLSVVVCTYNRRRMLVRALGSLCCQTLNSQRYDILVVDNNSRDDTRLAVKQAASTYPNVRYLREDKVGLSHARNRGAVEACGDYLLFIDDDAIAPPHYLEYVCRALEEHQPDILGGPIYPYYFDPKPRWFRDDWEVRRYATKSGFATSGGISGSNYVIRRDLLSTLGMFDPALGMQGDRLGLGEDRKVLETYRRRVPPDQQRVYYALNCTVLHLVPAAKMKLSYMLRRHFTAGRMNVTLKGSCPTTAATLRGLLYLPRMVYRKHLDVRRMGWNGIQPVEAVRRAVFQSGLVSEGFRQAALRATRRLRRATPAATNGQ